MIGLSEVNVLRASGLLPTNRYLDAVLRVRDHEFWAKWALLALLALGGGHLLSGIVFFFAYNWADMSASAKFAVVQVGIGAAALGALGAGLNRLSGQVLLVGASTLVGVLLAVVGQVYQTGADAFELFATWSLLIFPWTVVSRSAAHWLLWLTVAYVAFGLYGAQVLVPTRGVTPTEIIVLLGVVSASVLAVREFAVRAGGVWLAGQWTRQLTVFIGMAFLFAAATGYVLNLNDEAVAVIVFVASLAAVAVAYHRVFADFAVISQVVALASLFLIVVGWRLLDEVIGFEMSATRILPNLALLIVWCVIVVGGAGTLLIRIRKAMEQ